MRYSKFLLILLLILPATIVTGQPGKDNVNPHGDIKWDCGVCHNTGSWAIKSDKSGFNHDETGFGLVGSHRFARCAACHKDLKLFNVGSACADCHTDVHQGQLGNNCDNCHTPNSWENRKDVFEIHSRRGFPLVGVHSIADCGACHINQQRNEFTGVPTDCNGCHQEDFQAAADPNHMRAGFSSQCQSCHLPVATSWVKTTYQHTSLFILRASHLNLQCSSCHATLYKETSPECAGCHTDDYDGAEDPSHTAAGFPTDCIICHDETEWDVATFDHLQSSGYELRGAHQFISCNTCHINNQYSNLPQQCFGCHQTDYNETSDPNHKQGNYPQDCLMCHNENAWLPSSFDHSSTGFPLSGAHITVPCSECHINNQYAGTPTDCYTCHINDYNSVSDPNHVQNNFSHTCTQCHSTMAWSPSTFDHNLTDFPLTGAHTTLECVACHANGYSGTPTDCYTCHINDFNSANDPNHVQNNFSHTCTQCHSTTAWSPSTFDHNLTDFPLTGAHTSLECVACHANGYSGTPTDCYTCHINDFNSANDPNHVQNNYSHTCTQCHSTTAWSPATFDHNLTDFPLTGAHTTLECLACHANGYSGTPTDCYTCHINDYNSVSDPNHVQNNFSHTCTQCHSTTAWSPATFDHNLTDFPLTGAHTSLECVACHANGYSGTPTDCYSCHVDDYNSVDDPNHVQNNYSHNCLECHTTDSWDIGDFDHSQTDFPLTGAHTSLECIACHANGYSGTPTDCYTCHINDYNSVSDPNHVQNNFSHTCTQCHSTEAWSPSTFDHNLTDFPLTGAHTSLQCLACHANGYSGTPTDCYTCHINDYNSVSDPNHVQNNFSHTCTQCHSTEAWSPATFDHNLTDFPLTGAHTSLQCLACHANGYSGTPTDCYTCHINDYNSVSDPNHVQNNFSHTCTQCHSTDAWSPAIFDHNLTDFPLTGAHASLQCLACHANGYSGTPTDCYTCHINDYNSVSDPNHVQNNFSHTCTQCHSTTAWSPATFDHNLTDFPLTGAHISVLCIECHANGYSGTPTNCYSCHQDDYNNTIDPDHQAAGFPTTCENCHNTINWNQTTWNHDALYFPIYSGKHRNEWNFCADCHVNSNDFTVFECIFCHEHNRQEMDSKHNEVPGYQYLSSACYNCHPRGEALSRGKPGKSFE